MSAQVSDGAVPLISRGVRKGATPHTACPKQVVTSHRDRRRSRGRPRALPCAAWAARAADAEHRTIGSMSSHPQSAASQGQLVREIDAMGGVMARAPMRGASFPHADAAKDRHARALSQADGAVPARGALCGGSTRINCFSRKCDLRVETGGYGVVTTSAYLRGTGRGAPTGTLPRRAASTWTTQQTEAARGSAVAALAHCAS